MSNYIYRLIVHFMRIGTETSIFIKNFILRLNCKSTDTEK
jgi:hypothetical protein